MFLEEEWEKAKKLNSHKLSIEGVGLGLIVGFPIAQRMYPKATREQLTDAHFYVRLGRENVPIYVDPDLYPHERVYSAYIDDYHLEEE